MTMTQLDAVIQDLSATVDRALSPSPETPVQSAVHAEEVKAKTYDDLCTERRLAAFAMVGSVSALVFLARQHGLPIKVDELQPHLDRYNAADQALREFEKGRRP